MIKSSIIGRPLYHGVEQHPARIRMERDKIAETSTLKNIFVCEE